MFPPLYNRRETLHALLILLEIIHRLPKDLSHTRIATLLPQLLHSCQKLACLEVAGEDGSRIVGKDPQQHDAVVLHRGAIAVGETDLLADDSGGFAGGAGTGFGHFDYRGEECYFIALSASRVC